MKQYTGNVMSTIYSLDLCGFNLDLDGLQNDARGIKR